MMKPVAVAAVMAASVIGAAACSNQTSTGGGESGTPQSTGAAGTLKTELKTSDGTTVANASIDFTDGYATVTVQTVATGLLSPGFHGLQIHSVGRCDFASAGSPLQVSGHNTYSASGDLSDLQVRPDGSAKLVTTSADFTASDLQNGQGTALIVDAGPSNRSGASSSAESGKPMACGVIAAGMSASTSTSTSTVTTTVVAPGAPAGTPTSTTTQSPSTSSTTTAPSTSTSTSTVTVPSTTLTTTSPQVPNLPGQPGG